MENNKLICVEAEEDYRLIAISDVHGGVHLFKRLLERLNLKERDYLIVVGDFLERGPYSSEMLEYLKALCKRKNTYILSGNHEWYLVTLLLKEGNSEELLEYVRGVRYPSILKEWCQRDKLDLQMVKDASEFQRQLVARNREDIDLLNSLPYALEFDKFLFIHAGIDSTEAWKESRLETMLYVKSFLERGHCCDKELVVGHWPTSNYRPESLNSDVLIDHEKRIISIDGGYGVKTTGQLNALIIERLKGEYKLSSEVEEDFKAYTVKKSQFADNQKATKISWLDSRIELLDKGSEFSLCRKSSTGEKLYVKNEFIQKKDEGYNCFDDYVTLFLNVEIGETVKVVDVYGKYAFAKYRDEFGWIHIDTIMEA